MGSHTSPYGEPRTVAGYDVRFMVTTFTNSVARSLDVYAVDGDEDVLLTDESIDNEPSDDEIITMLDWACEEGKLPCSWKVEYSIFALAGAATVAESSCVVTARTGVAAERLAVQWVHDNDPHDDARIDPIVHIIAAERIPVGEEPEMADPRFPVTPERPITPDNARLSTEWFASSGGGNVDGAFLLNGLDVAHIHITVDGIVQVNVVQPGDADISRNYDPIEINMTPWSDRQNDPLIIRHTFIVPVENIGGQNHGHQEWLQYMVEVSGIDVGRVDNDNHELPVWLLEYTESGANTKITVHGTEKFLRFLCVLFDLHAEQYPGDPTPASEAENLERSIAAAKVDAMPAGPEKAKRLYELNGWLTVGQFRQATADQPDDKLIAFYDGSGYQHVEIVTEGPGDEPAVILASVEPFDTRHI